MKVKMVYGGGNGCSGGSCPTIYQDEDSGDYFVQGYNTDAVQTPDGESAVRLPKEFIEGFLQTMKSTR